MNRLSSLRSGALALALIAHAGCSDRSSEPADASGILRLEVTASAPEPRPRDVVTVGKLRWPDDPALVEVIGAKLERLPGDLAEDAPRLRMLPDQLGTAVPPDAAVRLKGRFDLSTFDQVVVTAGAAQDCYVRCVFRRDGLPILGSDNRGRIAPRVPGVPTTRAVLQLPDSRALAHPPDELELAFDNLKSPVLLGPIELCSQPIWARLPAAETGFEMVDLAGDARSSVGLSTERTLETELTVPRGAILRFSVAVPPALRLVAARPMLRVEVRGARGHASAQQLELDTDPKVHPRWQPVSLPLETFAGERVRIVYSLSVGEKREAACALTRPRIALQKRASKTVLLITSDTHRADFLGAAGAQPAIRTPVLDALARRGVLFEDCWSSTNVTIPSHVAIMTATSPRDSGVLDNYTRLAGGARTLAEAFQDAGFLTFAVVSAPHLSDAASGLGQGFDRLSAPGDVNKRRSGESVAQLISWIEEAEGQDLFLWLHLFDAHTPYAPPEEFERLYWPAERDAYDTRLPEPQVPAPYRVNLPEGVRDLGLLSARYSGEVSYLDRELARLLELPRVRAGVVALTADHGESLGEHGIFWEHAGLYPQTIHVPLIVAWPGATAGTRVAEPVFQLDLAQTLLQLAGAADLSLPGKSLFAPRAGRVEPRFTVASAGERASVTKDGWHLIVALKNYQATADGGLELVPKHRLELFDLARDPTCERDLARQEPARARELRRILCGWLAAATPRGWAAHENKSPEMAAHLAQLGYAASATAATLAPVDVDCACAECAPYK